MDIIEQGKQFSDIVTSYAELIFKGISDATKEGLLTGSESSLDEIRDKIDIACWAFGFESANDYNEKAFSLAFKVVHNGMLSNRH